MRQLAYSIGADAEIREEHEARVRDGKARSIQQLLRDRCPYKRQKNEKAKINKKRARKDENTDKANARTNKRAFTGIDIANAS